MDVENIIKSLKSKNSHRYDEISTKVLRMSSSFIINNNNILVEEQIGFRIKSLTDVAIYKLLNRIQKALGCKNLECRKVRFWAHCYSFLK
jgi:hypothetical protein